MSEVEDKVRFIKSWYTNECCKLSFGDSLVLARKWIEICISDEEYEMAAALKGERKILIKNHIKNKRKKRRLSQRIIVAIYLCKRKISVWIKKKLS